METQVHHTSVLIHAEVAAELWSVWLEDSWLFHSHHLLTFQKCKLLGDLIHSLLLHARQPWVLILRRKLGVSIIVGQLIESAVLRVLRGYLALASLFDLLYHKSQLIYSKVFKDYQ